METSPLLPVYGWSAYLGAAATILTFVTGILFFAVSQSFGKVNDISSVFQVIFMIPLVVMFVQLLPPATRTLRLIAALLGISGMLISAFGQSLLVFGRIDFQGSLKFFATVIGFLWGGQEHVLFTIGALVLGISYPIWAIWLGRLLLSGPLGKGAI
jgi:hypothetical protein